MIPFQLGALPALSRSTADRQEMLRNEPDKLRARWPNARVVLLDKLGRAPVALDALADVTDLGEASADVPLATQAAQDYGDEPPADGAFLGHWEGADYWLLPGAPPADAETVTIAGAWGVPQEAPTADGKVWIELRGYGAVLDDASAGLLTTAQALRNWHRRARFCARCGGPTRWLQFGWATKCDSSDGCGREEYPRTDPAVICLVHDDAGVNGEHVLLARQPVWPPGRYSVLAGFVEAGESLEGCVAREIREEVGVEVRDIRYLGSQPWPFPRSIMLGFAARTDTGAALSPADGEIEEARWVTRADVRAAFAGAHPDLLLPGNSSIAYLMLRAWAAAS